MLSATPILPDVMYGHWKLPRAKFAGSQRPAETETPKCNGCGEEASGFHLGFLGCSLRVVPRDLMFGWRYHSLNAKPKPKPHAVRCWGMAHAP